MKAVNTLILVILLTGALFVVDGVTPYSAANGEPKTYFFDRLGDLVLFGKEKDLYIERIDGGSLKKITSTPEIAELDAFFAYGGRYIVYKAEKKKRPFDKKPHYKYKYFMLPIDESDLKKKEIDEFVYRDFKKKRIREKNKTESERDSIR